jgi:hypothetical protein
MMGNAAALQAMAAKYLELAKNATDARECEKLREYATLYQDIAAQGKSSAKNAHRAAERNSNPRE